MAGVSFTCEILFLMLMESYRCECTLVCILSEALEVQAQFVALTALPFAKTERQVSQSGRGEAER